MKQYILTTILMMFCISGYAQDVDTEIWDDVLDYAVVDSVIIPEQTTLDISALKLRGGTTETKQPAEAPDDGEVHTMTLYLLDGTQVTYDEGDIYNVTYLPGVGMKVYLSGSTTSVDYLYSQMTKIEYVITSSTPDPTLNNVNANWNIAGMNIPQSGINPTFTGQDSLYNASTDNWAWRLEYPHINTASNYQRVVKAFRKTNVTPYQDYGITYSLEWDNSKIANHWVCYTMHAGNMLSKSGRSNDFKTDPAVTTSPASSYVNSSTYSRGHLCPSADRLCSAGQNKQTFFMTNMQPQYSNHNSGVWGQLEGYVRTKWSPKNATDTLYVVKAATIDNVTLNGNTSSGVYSTFCQDDYGNNLPVPKYFYMAFLYYEKSTNSFKAFALWTEHLNNNNPSAATVLNNKISIDELETRTGIDFFCNLPDDIEAEVEATAVSWDFSSNN